MTIFHKSSGKEYKILENGLKDFTTTLISHEPSRNKKRGIMGKRNKNKKQKEKKSLCVLLKRRKILKHNSKQKQRFPSYVDKWKFKRRLSPNPGIYKKHNTTTYHDDNMTTFTNNDCDLPFLKNQNQDMILTKKRCHVALLPARYKN